jgi:hypothetical protein
VSVHYEFYNGLPLLSKWVSVSANLAATSVRAGISSIESLNVNLQWGVYTLHPEGYVAQMSEVVQK